jgi:pimeloyl-ACP methyl ester carboxylesterase
MELGLLGAVAKLVGALWLGVSLAAYFAQDKLIFQPHPLPEEARKGVAARHPAAREVFIEAADGTRLHAWQAKGAPGTPLVIYFGGNAEEVSWMLDAIDRQASIASWLLVDYRGYGASGGAPSEEALAGDALAWYDAFHSGNERIFAFGRSLGSGVAVHLASQRRLDGVLLLTPYDSMVEVGKHHYPLLPVGLMLKHRFDSLAVAPHITTPLLCLAALDDEVIPVEHARRLYDAWAGEKTWVELRGGHNGADRHPDYGPAVKKFVAGS